MPELPEVQTTVTGLQKVLPGKTILDVWSDLPQKQPALPHFKDTLKSGAFFKTFTQQVINQRIRSVERRAKNILIHLGNNTTILVHMKMTGHLLYGNFNFNTRENTWSARDKGPLQDPFNRFLHVVISLSNNKQLALSDMRKFAKITLVPTEMLHTSKHLAGLGPEPLEATFTEKRFTEQLAKHATGKIKTVLMDQRLISGVGNIYSDEALWLAGIHPAEKVSNLTPQKVKALFKALITVLRKGIDFKGDSTSDYRTIDGTPGAFSHHHNAYRRTGKPCGKRGCSGGILRTVIGGRSAHYCSKHQTRQGII